MMRRPSISTLFPYTTLFRSLWAMMSISSNKNASAVRIVFWRQTAMICARVSRSEETRLNSSHVEISYAVFCLKKKKTNDRPVEHVLACRIGDEVQSEAGGID